MTKLAGPPPEGMELPPIFEEIAAGATIEPVWLNLEGGITARLGGDRFMKWSPNGSVAGECERLLWAGRFHPVPRVLSSGDTWFVTAAIDGRSALEIDPVASARALGVGLRALHESLPVDSCPFRWDTDSRNAAARGVTEEPPPIDRLVVCHGDACVPNTLVDATGAWLAHVDLGSLGVGDRWADLATSAMSLGWNFGEGREAAFFEAYGVEPDARRIDYYQRLWNAPDVKIDS